MNEGPLTGQVVVVLLMFELVGFLLYCCKSNWASEYLLTDAHLFICPIMSYEVIFPMYVSSIWSLFFILLLWISTPRAESYTHLSLDATSTFWNILLICVHNTPWWLLPASLNWKLINLSSLFSLPSPRHTVPVDFNNHWFIPH